MGMFKKSDEAKYLDNLLKHMRWVNEQMVDRCPADSVKAMEHVGSTLATLVSLRYIAQIIGIYAPTRAASSRIATSERVLNKAHKRAWRLSQTHMFDMQDAIALGKRECEDYLQHIGGDSVYLHEWKAEGHSAYRMKAARFADPLAEKTALDARYWEIIRLEEMG